MGVDHGFLDLPTELRDPETARFGVLPVPYDATSTWQKGADLGPDAMIRASAQVEWFDVETGIEVCREGIATYDPVLCDGTPEELAERVQESVSSLLERGTTPVVLGGEHSVSIGAMRATAAACPGVTFLQIDAHADTREEYEGSPCNHACVMARARELGPIVQVGIRSLERAECDRLDSSRVFFAHEIVRSTNRDWIARVVSLLSDHVYLTIDLDAFDPSLVPATGTPEPGGLSWVDVCDLIAAVCRERDVVACDVVELCPRAGQHASEFIAARLVHRVMSMIAAGARS